jgi:hypothetical protein
MGAFRRTISLMHAKTNAAAAGALGVGLGPLMWVIDHMGIKLSNAFFAAVGIISVALVLLSLILWFHIGHNWSRMKRGRAPLGHMAGVALFLIVGCPIIGALMLYFGYVQQGVPGIPGPAAAITPDTPPPSVPAETKVEFVKRIDFPIDAKNNKPLSFEARASSTNDRLRIFVDYSWRQFLGASTWTERTRVAIGEFKDVTKEQYLFMQLAFSAPGKGTISDLYWGQPRAKLSDRSRTESGSVSDHGAKRPRATLLFSANS